MTDYSQRITEFVKAGKAEPLIDLLEEALRQSLVQALEEKDDEETIEHIRFARFCYEILQGTEDNIDLAKMAMKHQREQREEMRRQMERPKTAESVTDVREFQPNAF